MLAADELTHNVIMESLVQGVYCLQLLEILEISWNLIDAVGKFI